MSVTISAWKRYLVRLYLQKFVGGWMFYLRFLCLLAYSGVQHILCCVFLRLVFSMLPVSLVLLIAHSVLSHVYWRHFFKRFRSPPWLRDMSPTNNVIHLVLVTCYNILNGAASKIDVEMHALSWCIKSPMTRLQSVKVTDFHHPWDTPETCTLDHIRSHYVEHNRELKASFSPRTTVDWNRLPQTAVLGDSVESFRTAITTPHP